MIYTDKYSVEITREDLKNQDFGAKKLLKTTSKPNKISEEEYYQPAIALIYQIIKNNNNNNEMEI